MTPPYLVLLRAGFCLPSVLPRTRCALTAPFHPYLSTRLFEARSRHARKRGVTTVLSGPAPSEPSRGESRGGMFSVPLSVRLPCPGVTRRIALWSSDFPPAL